MSFNIRGEYIITFCAELFMTVVYNDMGTHIASSFCPVYFCFTKAILLLCYLHLLAYVWFLTFGFLGLTPGVFLEGTCQKLPILC